MYVRSVFCAFFVIVNHYNKASTIRNRNIRNGSTESVIERPYFDRHDSIHGPVHRRYEFMEQRRLPKQKHGPMIRQQRLKNVQLQYNFKNLNVFAQQGEENFYEPYNKDGQWVFTRPMDKQFLFKWTWFNSTQTTPRGNLSDTAHRFCPVIWEMYGRVCGRRFDYYDWVYEHKEFKNLCELHDENMRVKKNHWYPLHANDCPYPKRPQFPYQWTRGWDLGWILSSVFFYANGSPHTVTRQENKRNKYMIHNVFKNT